MELRKPLTSTERRLFKESIIREYKLKHENHSKNRIANRVLGRLKALIPYNIVVGILASIVFVYLFEFKTLAYVFLFGIIWITLVSTMISLFIKT